MNYPMKLLVLLAATPLLLEAKKFYSDDPLWKMPEPLPAHAVKRDLSDFYDYFLYTFANPVEQKKNAEEGETVALGINTLGEVPDSEWFTNRIGRRKMTREELLRGPGDERPPQDGKWTIVSAKSEGLTPGFMIRDAGGERYLLKFDPMTNPEMASGADLLGTRFFHALGYNVPQNYIVHFTADRLEVGSGTTVIGLDGKERPMDFEDIKEILERVPQRPDGSIRALASRLLKGKPIGGFRYHGTRSDDPNDIYAHDRRRDLRGLYVFASWLGHDDSRAINTLDMLVEQEGKEFVRHHLIDFGSILGSASEEANSPRGGNQYLYELGPAFKQIFTLGFYVPRWYRWRYKRFPSIGRFEWEIYRPDEWKPEYKNPAFEKRRPDDTYWGAKKVMAFSDDDIRAIVELAEYSDKEASQWLTTCLQQRRDRVGLEYFRRVLPLDDFEVRGDRLEFSHLGERHGLFEAPEIAVSWSRFDNEAETHEPIEGAAGAALPQAARAAAPGAYFAARLTGDDPAKTVTVYLRKKPDGYQIVGADRTW